MSCSCLRPLSSKSAESYSFCTQKNLTKAALFVIGFLLASASIAAYFYGLGITGVSAFGVGSGLAFLAALVLHCATSSIRHDTLEQRTGLDLIRELRDTPKSNAKKTILLTEELKTRFGELFEKRKRDVKFIAWEISAYFFEVQAHPNAQKALINILFAQEVSLPFLAELFESTNMYTPEAKEYAFRELSLEIKNKHFEVDSKTNRLVNRTSLFTENGTPLSSVSLFYAKAIGGAVRLFFGDSELKLRLKISQNSEAPLPNSFLIHTLFYFENLPGLVALDLTEFTHPSGFGDEHYALLIEVVKSNPDLQEFKANMNGLSEKRKEEFWDIIELTLAGREFIRRKGALV